MRAHGGPRIAPRRAGRDRDGAARLSRRGEGRTSGAGRPASPGDRSAPCHGLHPAAGARALALRHELARKSMHLSSAAAPLAYAAGLPRSWMLGGLTSLTATALGIEVARHRVPVVRHHFHRATGALLRAHEHERLSGASWLLLAYTGAVAMAPRRAAIAAMWAVGVGDAAAAIVGRTLSSLAEQRAASAGRDPSAVAVGGKSFGGTTACALLTAAGARWIAGLPTGAAIGAGMAAAAAERPRLPIDDNVRVAVAVAAAVLGLSGASALD